MRPVEILVCVASKHGATEEIGERIATRLCARGSDVHVIPPTAHPRVDGYDAFVIGSALYMGAWMGEARDFIEANLDQLRSHPVWLFSSGPVTPVTDDPADMAEGNRHMAAMGAREHRLFAGRLQKEVLGLTERAIVRMVHSPWGDYRPWQEIDDWADAIARELKTVEV